MKEKQLSLKEAKRLSLIKWEDRKIGIKDYTEIGELRAHCGFCERYKNYKNCRRCEFGKVAGICCLDDGNLYSKWAKNRDSEGCQKIIDAIKSIPDE